MANIVTSFFKNSCDTYLEEESDLVGAFTRCMQVLWPLAAQRMNLDALTDCFGAILEYISFGVSRLNRLSPVFLLVVRSFRQAVGNASNKKKVSVYLCQTSSYFTPVFPCLRIGIFLVYATEFSALGKCSMHRILGTSHFGSRSEDIQV